MLILSLLVFVASYVLTGWLRDYALQNRLVDVPNARSSHVVPTPRGGGLAIVLVYLSSLGGLCFFEALAIDDLSIVALIFFSALVAAIGFWDDHRSIPATWRLAVHLTAAAGVLVMLPALPDIRIFSIVWSDHGWLFGFYTIMLIWLLNLYNFMDGIDGIASIEAMTTAGSAALLLFLQGQFDWALLMGWLALSVSGFLLWNWPPAKIFMGDACSGFLGFVLGLVAVLTALSGAMNVWSWWILLAVFIVDATVTLVRRVSRGEPFHQPHRSHAYQILSRRFGSHQKVTQGVLAINVFWLLPWAYLAIRFEVWAPAFCAIAMLPLIVVALQVGAGTTDD